MPTTKCEKNRSETESDEALRMLATGLLLRLDARARIKPERRASPCAPPDDELRPLKQFSPPCSIADCPFSSLLRPPTPVAGPTPSTSSSAARLGSHLPHRSFGAKRTASRAAGSWPVTLYNHPAFKRFTDATPRRPTDPVRLRAPSPGASCFIGASDALPGLNAC